MPSHSATDRLQTSPGQWPHLQTTHDPVPQPPSDGEDLPVDFNNYVRQLQCHQWTMFEIHEGQFRKSLDTKLLQERAHFACSGDPAKWSKVASILTGVFFQNGIFRTGNINRKEFGLPLLKYATRILKKFPLSDKHPMELTPASITSWIERQLIFVRDVIQPSLSRRAADERHKRQRRVSRDKLSYLWQHRRSKAIDIIENNSMFPSPPPTVNNTTDVYKYYMAKCQSPLTQTLTPPPWSTSLVTFIPDYYPSTAKFTFEEADKVISHLPNNSASGYDGVTYETIKARKPQSTQILTYLFNTCLINGKVPGSWKGALIHRIPKKDNIPSDPSTWRDISLLPTVYKIFMKCLLGRILPWLVDTGILSPKQKAYIARQGMNEHVFCLKTGVDDFKHESSKLFTVFLDFRDAFGTLSHKIMLNALKEIHLPQPFADLITDVYKGSFLQVICGHQLTEPIPLQVGIKTGCPWRAVNFILAINQWLKWLVQCAPPDIRSPNPVQGYADDVEVSSRDESVIHNMLARTDEFLHWSKLEVKHTKCAALYERRSGGNR